jgi:hypothetical protein
MHAREKQGRRDRVERQEHARTRICPRWARAGGRVVVPQATAS